MSKTYDVIIIGGGWSGVYALKHCLEEGLDAIILEAHTYPLGNWHYRKRPGGVFRRTHAISSLAYLQPSDFPFPEDTPELPHHDIIEEHMLNYIEHFNLKDRIRLGVRVLESTKENDIWQLHSKEHSYAAKKLVLATGQTTRPKRPGADYYNNFKGPTMHTAEFNESHLSKYSGKNILVIGGGIESCDIACLFAERSNVALSIRSGQWFQPLVMGAFEPADTIYSRFAHRFLPIYYFSKYFNGWFLEVFFGKGGSGIPGWEPGAGHLNGFYNKNREVIRLIAKGKIAPKKEVHDVHENYVEFKDEETSRFDVDLMVFGTGYSPEASWDFLPDGYHDRYKKVFAVKDASLAFVGFARPFVGGIPYMSEVQSRVIAQVFSGKISLPDADTMMAINAKDRKKQLKEFPRDAQTNTAITNPYNYADEMAAMIGAKPKKSLMVTNPLLWWKLMRQTYSTFAFRLHDEDPAKRRLAVKQIERLSKKPVVRKLDMLSLFILSIELSFIFVVVLILLYIFK